MLSVVSHQTVAPYDIMEWKISKATDFEVITFMNGVTILMPKYAELSLVIIYSMRFSQHNRS
jgi:hypothetical protein